MLLWLLGVAAFVLLLGALFRSSPKAGIGALLGVGLAWFLSRFMTPYVTGMETIPLWLPPLPLAIVAITLLVFGVVVWFRADNLPPPKARDAHDEHHGDH